MAKKRQIILVGGENGSLGSLRDFVEAIGRFNTAPDGSGPEGMGLSPGMATLYGPGIVVEIATGGEEVSQAMTTLVDEDYAWPVLTRLCRETGWKMVDMETGRTFG